MAGGSLAGNISARNAERKWFGKIVIIMNYTGRKTTI